MVEAVDTRLQKHELGLHRLAEKCFQESIKAVGKETQLLAQIAGGGPNGAAWWASKDESTGILEHYERTLAQVRGQQISSHAGQVKKALEAVAADKNSFGVALPHEELQAPQHQAILDEAKMQLARASATRCEVLVCKALSRPGSSKTKGRLSESTAEFSSETRENWRAWLCPDLIALVEEAMA